MLSEQTIREIGELEKQAAFRAENARLLTRVSGLEQENGRLEGNVEGLKDNAALLSRIIAALRADLAREREQGARLRATIRYLLLSADCSWEENNEGHDWAQACQMAREILKGVE